MSKRSFRKFRRSLTKRSIKRPNLFINPSDHMGFDILIDGQWDPFLTKSIRAACSLTKRNIFIDIGANIGLISVQVQDAFSQIIAVEPNPISFGVLQANTLLNIPESKITLKNYGLGNKTEIVELAIPLHNLGGAFIEVTENQLTREELREKEGGELNIRSRIPINVTPSAEFFDWIMQEQITNKEKLVIKIDVEGLEAVILDALLASSLWKSQEVICFLETWSSSLRSRLFHEFGSNCLVKKRNFNQWGDFSTIKDYEECTEFCIWNTVTTSVTDRILKANEES